MEETDFIKYWSPNTMEPLNNSHIGSSPFVYCRGVSLSGRLTHNLVITLSTLSTNCCLSTLAAIITWFELFEFVNTKL